MNLNGTTFNDSKPHFPIYIWPLGIGFIIGGVIGLFGNAMIMIALVKSTDLRKNRCNTLVGHLALFDFLTCISMILCGGQAMYQSFIPIVITNEDCYYSRIHAIISYNGGSLLILVIGIDRMVALWWPLSYKNLSRGYIFIAVVSAWLFGLINAGLGFVYKDSRVLVRACALPTALRGPALLFWNYSNIAINILVIGAYFLAYHRAKSLAAVRSSTNDQILRSNRLLASLLICVVIYMVGWMVTMLVIFMVRTLSTDSSTRFHVYMYIGLLATINVGCNFYVYYNRSVEYRRAFRRLLGLKGNEVVAMSVTNRQPTQNANKKHETF